MKIDISKKGIYHIFRIEEDLNIISDLSELRILILGYLHQGKNNIAISFTNTSYIYSGAIAVLVDCYKQIRDGKGRFCIIESIPEIVRFFNYLKLDKIFPIYTNLDDLINETNQKSGHESEILY